MDDNKTFTQEEVNAIISERLKSGRSKIMKDVQAKEAELARRESLINATADWKKRGLPVELLDMIPEDKFESAATALEGYQKTGNKGGWGGGKNPGRALSPEEAEEIAIRDRMGLNRKDD